MKKIQSSKKVLNQAVKSLTDIDLVFMRELLLSSCEQIIANKDEVTTSMENSFISPKLYIECVQNIFDKVKFED
jgi:hypothetical protein